MLTPNIIDERWPEIQESKFGDAEEVARINACDHLFGYLGGPHRILDYIPVRYRCAHCGTYSW